MDAAAVENVWNSFNTRLERFVRSRVEDTQAADDVLQDVYLKIHRSIDSLHDEERLQAWIYQITRNTIHDYYRSQKALIGITELDDDTPLFIQQTEDTDDEITQRLVGSVRAMIDALPEDYRQALLLTEIDGLTQRELAERLGISLSGAKSRVQRGRRLLREMLLACCHFEFDRLGKVIDYYPHCKSCMDDACSA